MNEFEMYPAGSGINEYRSSMQSNEGNDAVLMLTSGDLLLITIFLKLKQYIFSVKIHW